MAVCKLKKTTMLLVLLSLPLLLLITNSPLKCEPLDRGAGGVEQGRVRASDEEEKQGVSTFNMHTHHPPLMIWYRNYRESPSKVELCAAVLPSGVQQCQLPSLYTGHW